MKSYNSLIYVVFLWNSLIKSKSTSLAHKISSTVGKLERSFWFSFSKFKKKKIRAFGNGHCSLIYFDLIPRKCFLLYFIFTSQHEYLLCLFASDWCWWGCHWTYESAETRKCRFLSSFTFFFLPFLFLLHWY